jgi:hypothetical protein
VAAKIRLLESYKRAISMNNKRAWRGMGKVMLVSMLLTGCSTTESYFKPVAPIPAGKGVVYLYRLPEPGPDNGKVALISAGKSPIGTIGEGRYLSYVGAAGPVYFRANSAAGNIGYANLEAGKEKFLRAGYYREQLKFSPVTPEVGRSEIAGCVLSESSRANQSDSPLPATDVAAPSVKAPTTKETQPGTPAVVAAPRHRASMPYPRPKKRGMSGSRPTIAAEGQQGRVQGPLSFEAERIAMAHGCSTPDGVRPVGFLVRQEASLQVYDVGCGPQHIRVNCQFEYCELVGR